MPIRPHSPEVKIGLSVVKGVDRSVPFSMMRTSPLLRVTNSRLEPSGAQASPVATFRLAPPLTKTDSVKLVGSTTAGTSRSSSDSRVGRKRRCFAGARRVVDRSIRKKSHHMEHLFLLDRTTN